PGREFSRRLAANTQLILRHESHLGRTQDPAGGSWYVEWLTDELSGRAWALFQEIEAAGGMVTYLGSGRLESRLAETRERRRRRISYRRDPITGISEFPFLEEAPPAAQADRRSAVAAYLRHRAAARQDLTPLTFPEGMVEAASGGASLASLAGFDRSAAEPVAGALGRVRNAEPFEALRRRSEAFRRGQGSAPRVLLLNLGLPSEHRLRTGFASNLLAAGGVEAVSTPAFEEPAEAVAAFAESGLRAVILCSSNEAYQRLVPATAPGLRKAGARRVVLAGHPGDHETAFRHAEVDSFIFLGCDVLEFLERLYQDLEAVS
ncbi:MAG: methylmalonyl-CoA mutase, partial [Acidobacteria bacterium]|nr:methylmalonyl-CoA mutase [Acidobacteriota bacterium]